MIGARVSTVQSAKSPNKSKHLTFDSPLGLATPSPAVESNSAELRRYALGQIGIRIHALMKDANDFHHGSYAVVDDVRSFGKLAVAWGNVVI